jgi:hypothetical protein
VLLPLAEAKRQPSFAAACFRRRRILPQRGAYQGLLCRGQVRPARELDDGDITAEQRFDIREVFSDRDLIALPFVVLVPLVMVVENQSDDVVKAVDETIGRRGRIDEAVEPAVEVGKVVKPVLDFPQQSEMLLAQRFDLLPKRRAFG